MLDANATAAAVAAGNGTVNNGALLASNGTAAQLITVTVTETVTVNNAGATLAAVAAGNGTETATKVGGKKGKKGGKGAKEKGAKAKGGKNAEGTAAAGETEAATEAAVAGGALV